MIATLLSALFALTIGAAMAALAASLHQYGTALLDVRNAWRTCPESLTMRFQIREMKAEQRLLPVGAKILTLPVRRTVQVASPPQRLAA